MAVKALYRNIGARRQLRDAFAGHVNVADASETDRALLLLCAHFSPAVNEGRR
jgi:hypothetical protein